MTANGPTLIAEGVAWGYRVLSPTEPFTKVEGTGSIPADTIATYGHPRWRKIMVLMTDGDNDLSPGSYAVNGTTYSAYGRGKETLAVNRFGTTTNSAIEPALDTAHVGRLHQGQGGRYRALRDILWQWRIFVYANPVAELRHGC